MPEHQKNQQIYRSISIKKELAGEEPARKTMINQTAKFNAAEHMIVIKNRQGGASDYLPVKWRIVGFRKDFPEGVIETEVILIDMNMEVESEQFVWNAEKRRNEKVLKKGKGFACIKATVRTGQGGSSSATGSESAVDFGDFIEKAETKAIGRALAGLGYGTEYTGAELEEGTRLVDSPFPQQDAPAGEGDTPASQPQNLSIARAPQPVADSAVGLKTRCAKLRIGWGPFQDGVLKERLTDKDLDSDPDKRAKLHNELLKREAGDAEKKIS